MHVAVLDDDVASRNQMNRLLTRASDNNKKNGKEGYYIDLYGSFESIMPKVAMYDAIFIDMLDKDHPGHIIAKQLLENGIKAKIIMCSSQIPYKGEIYPEDHFKYIFMDKPIKTSELRSVLDICESASAIKIPKLEIRTQNETIFVKYEDFLYLTAIEPGKCLVTVNNHDDITYYTDFALACSNILTHYDFIIQINNSTLVSTYHIKSVSVGKVVMDSGKEFKIPLFLSGKLKKYQSK